MLLKDGKKYYALDFSKLEKDGKVYYDRTNRKKSYFFLDFRANGYQIVPPKIPDTVMDGVRV